MRPSRVGKVTSVYEMNATYKVGITSGESRVSESEGGSECSLVSGADSSYGALGTVTRRSLPEKTQELNDAVC